MKENFKGEMMNKDQHRALREIREHQSTILNAEREIGKLVKIVLPKNTLVSWFHGDHTRYGVVIDYYTCGQFNRVKVQSEASAKEYWIDSSKILRIL